MSTRLNHLIGLKIGKVRVISYHGIKNKVAYFNCECECGVVKPIHGSHLNRGIIKSCGCLKAGNNIKHGESSTKLYKLWSRMIERCHSPKSPQYKNYGARGIFVCERWRSSFLLFKEDVIGGYRPKLQLDRINNNDGYYKENCRWVTSKENNNNKRTNCYVEYNNEIKTASQWANIFGLKSSTIRYRLLRGLQGGDAIFGKAANSFCNKKQYRNIMTPEEIKQKNIDFAADLVAQKVFYHFTDNSNKELLKDALIMFANIIINIVEDGEIQPNENIKNT